VCATCISSGKHRRHDVSDILEQLGHKKQRLQKDMDELKAKLQPQYENIFLEVKKERSKLESKYGKLTRAADEQGEVWWREIAAIIDRRKSDIKQMKNKHLAVIEKRTNEISHRINEIKEAVLQIQNILDTNDIFLISAYKSRNTEFEMLPPKIKATMPSLSPSAIDIKKLNEMFGSLSSLSITTVKPFLSEPRVTATVSTGYDSLRRACCLNENQIWTRGDNNVMKLLDLQGKLLATIKTETGGCTFDIAVMRDGNLVYSDYSNRTINIVKKKHTETLITFKGWKPRNLCSTSSDDLLISMLCDYESPPKVVRYTGSTEKQIIQFDDQGRPLFSPSGGKYITENRNLDICVADDNGRAVVVVNQSGKLRFRYRGIPSNATKSFDPIGITTDSQSQILTADADNNIIHIINENGQFLRYIQSFGLNDPNGLNHPNGLSMDSKDNLFVAEWDTAKVKKIQYLST
jgi:streptogramin lyase